MPALLVKRLRVRTLIEDPQCKCLPSSLVSFIHYWGMLGYSMKRVIKDETEEQYYAYNITLLEDFFRAYLSNELQRSLLSEDVSVVKSLNEHLATQSGASDLPIENIVSTQINHKLFVESIDKDVILYFHAPW